MGRFTFYLLVFGVDCRVNQGIFKSQYPTRCNSAQVLKRNSQSLSANTCIYVMSLRLCIVTNMYTTVATMSTSFLKHNTNKIPIIEKLEP